MKKRFIPCIYLYNEHAVRSMDDLTVVETDPIRLAKSYNENHADELIIIDLSENDELHEKHLDLMKEIAALSEIDVIGGGNVKRMEDIKKILYTGCKRAILNFDISSNVEILEEVSLKFGNSKILVAASSCDVLNANRDRIEQFASEVILLNPHIIKEAQNVISLPCLVQIRQLALNKLFEVLEAVNVSGITGNAINENVSQILQLKELCKEKGLEIASLEAQLSWSDFKLTADGLLPVIVQDYRTNEVLMMAYMNEAAFLATLLTGKMNYYSRSRKEQWLKGETSGHYQYVKTLTADCDKDTLLAKVSQVGVACHTGARSCFFQEVVAKDFDMPENPLLVFEQVLDVIKDRKIHPKEGSYTNYLFDKGIDKILKKLGEEATEIVIAAKNPNANEVKYEISDFLYHMMVLMVEKGVTWEEITTELANR